jgi:uncharacterized protein
MFTYFTTSVGAFFLHLATSVYLYGNGKVLGCSSILYKSLFDPSVFNLPVTVGIGLGTLAVKYFAPEYLPDYQSVAAIAPLGKYTPFVAGLLSGVGTKFGAGCTSGHMLCGLARLSIRSLVATMTFCATAVITSHLLDTAPGCVVTGLVSETVPCHTLVHPSSDQAFGLLALAIALYGASYGIRKFLTVGRISQTIVSVFSGFVFGTGLVISGLASPAKTLGFLALLPPKFDPSLLMVMAFGVLPNAVEIFVRGYNLGPRAAVSGFDLPARKDVPVSLVAGAAVFGVGWGLSGICPGPGIVAAMLGTSTGLSWVSGFFISYHLSSYI